MSQSVHRRVDLRALLVLMCVITTPRAALRGGAQGARVEYGRCRLGRPAFRKAQEYAQIVDHRFEDARREPPPRLLVDSFPRRKIVWHIAPGRAGAHDPPQPVKDLAKLVVALRSVFSDQR